MFAGVVSFSSRLVAGMRAHESLEENSLFDDPLAEVLAGGEAMKKAKSTLKVSIRDTPSQVQHDRSEGNHYFKVCMLQDLATGEDGGEADEGTNGRSSDHIKRKYMVGRVALRTKFFDTRLLEAVSSGPPAAVRQVKASYIYHRSGLQASMGRELSCGDRVTFMELT